MKRVFHITILLVTVVAVFVSCSDKPDNTIANLKVAITKETNASAAYKAFQAKATEEGYQRIANMFKAVAEAEEYHIRNHNDVLKKMGEEVFRSTAETPTVSGTIENIHDAINDEKNEYTVTYPGFIAAAKKGKFEDAATSFTLANKAEENHEEWFSDVLRSLNEKGNEEDVPPVWFVCTRCGGLFTNHFSKCELCQVETERQNYIPKVFDSRP